VASTRAEQRRRRWPGRPRALKDILAGLAFVAFGLAFAVSATAYEIGTTVRMGPGYFPLVLGGLLVLLGGLIVAKGFIAGEEGTIGTIPWRALALIVGAVLLFGLTVRGLGLVPSTFVTALLSAFASRRAGVVAAVLITFGLTVLCVLVFVVVLSLRLPLVGTWIRI
jgi:putative tricarboxylic transport membrane protein